MTDIFDQAQALEQQQLDQALIAQKKRAAAHERLLPTGYCQNPKCGEEFTTSQLFCNHHCAAEYQRIHNRK